MALDMSVTEMPIEILDRAFAINTRGTMLMIKHGITLMLKHGRGSIINISLGAALRGGLYESTYASYKAETKCPFTYFYMQSVKNGTLSRVISSGLVGKHPF